MAVPAMLGAVTLTVLWTVAIGRAPFGDFFDYFSSPWTKALVAVCYLPLLAWGPLLAALTMSYYRRRSSEGASSEAAVATASLSTGRRDQ
ncbi:hypothetical protein [Nocardioides albertanoniae]|uniref:hypothetical protein n=1 Tax=Nocardioides albertanoniae TaxID=1175486 RepID=UPI001FEC61D0|nr:hypothetical protein [Nocardioides albertanoniae]